jgi:hypothetical protein
VLFFGSNIWKVYFLGLRLLAGLAVAGFVVAGFLAGAFLAPVAAAGFLARAALTGSAVATTGVALTASTFAAGVSTLYGTASTTSLATSTGLPKKNSLIALNMMFLLVIYLVSS